VPGKTLDRHLSTKASSTKEMGKRARSLGVKMVSVAVVVVTAAYLLYVRPWQLRWGAIDEEIERPMPGDEIVKRPTL